MEPLRGDSSIIVSISSSLGVDVCAIRCTKCGYIRFYDKDKIAPVHVGRPPNLT